MDGVDWADPNARTIAIYLDGSDDPDLADDGTFLVDDDFLVRRALGTPRLQPARHQAASAVAHRDRHS